jgi:membrane dipeptidase
MLIVDSHLDLSMSALDMNRDLTLPVSAIRAAEAGMEGKSRGMNTVSLPDMRRGGVGLCLATVIARANPGGTSSIDFRNQALAYATAQGQLAYYRSLERQGYLRMLCDWTSIDRHVKDWNAGQPGVPIGYVFAMEGADPIERPAQVSEWYAQGLRVVSLAHYGPSAYAHGTGSSGGLTPAGRELLGEMRRLGMILDVTHLAEESFWEALKLFNGPVMASHNNCRALRDGERQFSDEQIRALVERDAVTGVALDAWMLHPDWCDDPGRANPATFANVADNIDHLCQVAGDTRHAAIGSDLDGGYGREQSPADLDTIADLQKLTGILEVRGYSSSDIANVMHGNWLRLFQRALA